MNKKEKITVTVSDEGHVLLEDIFPGRDISRIEFYDVKTLPDGTISIRFYDKDNNLIKDLG